MHAVGIVGRFHANPKETHLQAVKRIFKYLQGTQNYGLWYPRDTDLTLHAYTDADWAGSVDDRIFKSLVHHLSPFYVIIQVQSSFQRT